MDEASEEQARKILDKWRRGKLSLEETVEKLSSVAPHAMVTSLLTAQKAMESFEKGAISLEEAETIVHEQADAHPSIPAFFIMCAALANARDNQIDEGGYLALVKLKSDSCLEDEDMEYIDEKYEGFGRFVELLEEQEELATPWPYVREGGDHLVNNFLAQYVASSEDYLEEELVELILSRKEAVAPVLLHLTDDLIKAAAFAEIPPGLVDLVRLIGHLRPRDSLNVLLRALDLCIGEELHEAVIALAKLGSEHQAAVSDALKEVVRDPEWGEARLAAVEALGLMHDFEGNRQFLEETLGSLDWRDEDAGEMFDFLVWSLLCTGREEAAGTVSSFLNEHKERIDMHSFHFAKKGLEGFEPSGDIDRLSGICSEDIFEICCGPISEGAEANRVTMTMVREVSIAEEIDGAILEELEVEEWLKTGRNEPCPCGSGKKFKKCCLPGIVEALGPDGTSPVDR